MVRQKILPLIMSIIIKTAMSFIPAFLLVTRVHAFRQDTMLLSFISCVLLGGTFYAFCSLVQLAKSFTYNFNASTVSAFVLYFAYSALISNVSEDQIPFVLAVCIHVIYKSAFLIYDIIKLVVLICTKGVLNIKSDKVVDIPEAIKELVTKAISKIKCYITNKSSHTNPPIAPAPLTDYSYVETYNEGDNNDVQDTYSE